MSLLKDAVFTSTSYHGRKRFKFNQMTEENKILIKSVTKRQRRKFKNFKIVPLPVLEVLWNMGFLPGDQPPAEGMKIPVLLEYLTNGNYKDSRHHSMGIWLRDKIDLEEFKWDIDSYEMYIKSGSKFIPISYLREIPGTIFH
jgi:hypothetical protein